MKKNFEDFQCLKNLPLIHLSQEAIGGDALPKWKCKQENRRNEFLLWEIQPKRKVMHTLNGKGG